MPKSPERIAADLPKRFWAKVQKTDDCWLWMASRNECGYGKFRIHGKSDRAHRVGYLLTYGPIPDGLCVLHKCDNPQCVRPDHMFLGTKRDNAIDRAKKGRAPKGEQASWSKLTEAQVLAILADTRQQKIIAAEYGVCKQAISDIKCRRNWKHLHVIT